MPTKTQSKSNDSNGDSLWNWENRDTGVLVGAAVAGVAARSASGFYGPMRACAGTVAMADLMLGDAVAPVLEAHLRAAGGRLRGIRNSGPGLRRITS